MDWVRIGRRLAAAACAVALTALAGCGGLASSAGGPGANGSPASGGSGPTATARPASTALRTAALPSATPRTAALSAPWAEREVLPEGLSLAVAFQAYDPATGTVYALLPEKPGNPDGPRVLTAIDVRTGVTRHGGTYEASEVTLADGCLWIYDNAGKSPQVDEVAAGTLATVRAIPLPSSLGPFGAGPAVAGAPDGSAWMGGRQALLRVSVRTGTVLAQVALPAGLALATMAADPDGDYLYVAAAHEVGGGAVEGAVILEYSESTGALLATADGVPISNSIAGAALTAVPGGVWASFRTGMLGMSALLSGRGLAVIAAVDPLTARLGAYYWAMSSVSAYGGGTLWVAATDDGLVACLNPATGKVIAQEDIPSAMARPDDLLTVDPATRELYGTVIDGTFGALVSITPPAACWG